MESINETLLELTTETIRGQLINRVVVSIIIFFVGLIIGRLVGRFVERLLREFAVDATMRKHLNTATSFQKVIGRLVSAAIYIIFLLIALNYVGVVGLLFNIISIAIVVMLVISFAIAINDAMPNIIAYRFIQRNKSFCVGDTIEIGVAKGEVQSVTLFETRIVTSNDDVIHIPNALFMKESWSKKDEKKAKKKED